MVGKSWNPSHTWSVSCCTPFNFLVATFYLMLGSYFFLYFRRDFEMSSAKGLFYDRKYAKLCKERGFDPLKVEFLQNYVDELR